MTETAFREIDVALPGRKWRRYPGYKPTALDWCLNIPKHWPVSRLKYLAAIRAGENITGLAFDDNGEFPVYGGNGIRGYTTRFSHDGNFVLIGRQGALCGNVHRVKGKFWASEHAAVATCCRRISVDWFAYLVEAMNLKRHSETAAQPGLALERVGRLPVPCPPLDEQSAIAAFLDRETAKIDELIAKKRRFIELLEIKRRTIIEHAVTRGLSKAPRMKTIDVGWLNSVPAHWRIHRIANLFRDTAEPGNEELPILSVSIHAGISDEQIADEDMDRKVLRSEDKSKYIRVIPGDLVYNMMRAWQGGFGAAKVEGMVSPAYVVARPVVKVSTQFVEHLLRTPNAVEEMRRNSYGVADFRLRLYWDQFKNIRVALPPIAEAEDICKYIEGISLSVKRVTEVTLRTIGALQQLRASLITAAVTGQIDVRNHRTEVLT